MRSLRSVSSLALLPLLLTVVACSDDSSGLVKSGTLTVCSDTPYEPFEFTTKAGAPTGFDLDLLRAIAKKADLGLAVKDLPFDGILGTLAAGKCDVVASAVSITPARKKQIDFSAPYFDADQSLLVRSEDAAAYATLDGLAGQTIGVQQSTTGATYAKAHTPPGATIKDYPDADALFAALTSKQIAAVLQDLPVNGYRATKGKDFVVTDTFPTGEQYGFAVEQYGFAVEKGDKATLKIIDDGLAAVRKDGEYDKLFTKYFGES
jgi:polar amino acid transport system substrate-binding protein